MTAPRSTQAVLLTATAATGVSAAPVWLGVAGWRAGVSALIGTAIVAMFYSSGAAALAVADGGRSPRYGLGLMLLTYVLRLVVVVALLRVIDASGVLHPRALGITVLACAAVWPVVQAVRVRRMPTLVIEDDAATGRS